MNNMFGNPGMTYGNYGQGTPIAKARMSNPLTGEEKDALKTQAVDQFNLSIDVAEMAKAICTHKDPNTGLFTTVENPDGTITCTVCHETFDPDACTPDEVQDVATKMKNVLQTLKFLALDLPDEVIRGFFGFLPYIDKVPQLYKIAVNTYNRYNNPSLHGNLQANNGANIYGAFNNIMNPTMPVYNSYMMGQQQMQQPFYNPQQAAMMMGQQQMPGNPFYAQQMQQPMGMPQQQPFYNQQMPQQAAPAQPTVQQMPPQQSVTPVAGQPEQVVVKEQLTL